MKRERFWRWASYRLPKKLIYFAAIRLGAYATTGKYGNMDAPAITLMDAIGRWSDYGKEGE